VDRSVEPVDGSVVVAVVDGELTIKRLVLCNGVAELRAENPKYSPIWFKEGQELTIWGVVTSAVHLVK
ncbi:MAG: S24 family peptidase, partial [Gallionella sp.]